MKNLLELIKSGNPKELSAHVFDQKLDAASTSGFTLNLYEAEENEVIRRLLEADEPSAWVDFLNRYTSHYPLFNSAVRILLEATDKSYVRDLLVQEFSRYGYNEEQGMKVCNLFLRDNTDTYIPLLETIAHNGRIYFENIHAMLEKIDDRRKENHQMPASYATIYKSSIDAYYNNVSKH